MLNRASVLHPVYVIVVVEVTIFNRTRSGVLHKRSRLLLRSHKYTIVQAVLVYISLILNQYIVITQILAFGPFRNRLIIVNEVV